jgi:hypothetical protein
MHDHCKLNERLSASAQQCRRLGIVLWASLRAEWGLIVRLQALVKERVTLEDV